MNRLILRFLGGFQAQMGSGTLLPLTARKAQALLAYLAVRPGSSHPRDKLSTLLWPETSDNQARQSLRVALVALRRALPATRPPILVAEGESLAITASAVDVDVAAFERCIEEGTPDALAEAARLYQGDFLEGFRVTEPLFEDWLRTERARLHELALEGLARLLQHQRAAGPTDAAIRTCLRLLALDPLQEPVHRALMQLYADLGRRGAALRQYQFCVGLLQRELRVEPEPETRALYRQLLRLGSARPSQATLQNAAARVAGEPPPVACDPSLDGIPVIGVLPLIGRDSELARIRAEAEAARGGTGRVVLVLGDAGIGKTRLVDDVVHEATLTGHAVLFGRAHESSQILPFGPWREALAPWVRAPGEDLMEDLAPAWRRELARVFPDCLAAESDSPPSSGDYTRLFEAIAALLATFSSRSATLLVLEDAHWADEMSLRLLSFLSRRVSAWPLLILVTARNDDPVATPALRVALRELDRDPKVVRLGLLPLSRAETAALVRTLMGSARAEADVEGLTDRAWALSEGNPFTVVELVRAIEEGRAAETDGALPHRVRELILSRIETLSDRARRVLEMGAVIGREFGFALLQHAAGLDGAAVAEALEELVRRRLIQVVGDHFDFTHDRVRAVAYGDLLPPRRALLHGQVGAALESLYSSEVESQSSALGFHYQEARNWAKAVTYLSSAGRAAANACAFRQAAVLMEQAREAFGHLPETLDNSERKVELLLSLSLALLFHGRHAPALAHLHDARAIAEALGDEHRLARVSVAMARVLRSTGDHHGGIEWGRRALSLSERVGEGPLGFVAKAEIGASLLFDGYSRQAVDVLGPLTRQFTSIRGDGHVTTHHLVQLRYWLALAHASLGEFPQAFANAEASAELAASLRSPLSEVVADLGLAAVCVMQGAFERAVPVAERAIALSRDVEIEGWRGPAAWILGVAYLGTGRAADGVRLLHEARQKTIEMQGQDTPLELYLASRAALGAGDLDEARLFTMRALAAARDRRSRAREAQCLRILGEIATRRESTDPMAAEQHFREAILVAEELGLRPEIAFTRLALARLQVRLGKWDQARLHGEMAIAMFRGMGMEGLLARAEHELRPDALSSGPGHHLAQPDSARSSQG